MCDAAGTAVVTFSASTLGLYRVHVFGGRARDLLPDCPVALTVVPGVVDVEKVALSVLPPAVCADQTTLVAAAAGKKDRKSPASKMIEVEAGAQLQVALQARDTAGNSGTWGGVDLTTVHAEVLGQEDGGEYVAVGLTAVLEDDQKTLQLSAKVLKAGSYLLSVSIEGRVPASFPRALQVCDSPLSNTLRSPPCTFPSRHRSGRDACMSNGMHDVGWCTTMADWHGTGWVPA